MSLFEPVTNERVYLKAGILGFTGSGKTYTASLIARGVALLAHEQRKPDRPPRVFFLDTEKAVVHVRDLYEKRGVELLVAKTRAFADLLDAVQEAERNADVLVIDSISATWKELMEAYKRKKNRDFLRFDDWGAIKGQWGRFTDAFINSELNIVLCGRAGFEYDYETDEKGKKELVKTGIKMKTETELGYEPSLLLYMDRIQPVGQPKAAHRCEVWKDRWDLLDGQVFDNPSFESFAPVVAKLSFVDGEHKPVRTDRSSEDLFHGDDNEWRQKKRQQDILTEEIEGVLLRYFPGSTKAERFAKSHVIHAAFGTSSWTKVKTLQPEALKDGLEYVSAMCIFVAAAEEMPEDSLEFLAVLEGVRKHVDEERLKAMQDGEMPEEEVDPSMVVSLVLTLWKNVDIELTDTQRKAVIEHELTPQKVAEMTPEELTRVVGNARSATALHARMHDRVMEVF